MLGAGVIFAIVTGLVMLGGRLIQEIIETKAIGGAVLMVPFFVFGLFLRAVILGSIVAALVWFARKFKSPFGGRPAAGE